MFVRFSQVATQSATIKRDNTYGPTISSIMFSLSSWLTKSSGSSCIWDGNHLQVIAKGAKYVAYYSQGYHRGAFRLHKLHNLGIKSFKCSLRDVGGNGGARGIRAPRLGSHSLAKTGICGASTNALFGLAPSFRTNWDLQNMAYSLLSSMDSYTHYLFSFVPCRSSHPESIRHLPKHFLFRCLRQESHFVPSEFSLGGPSV
jgi:hypothetical protein